MAKTISLSSIIATNGDGLKFELLDHPFSGPLTIDAMWGAPPPDLALWFRHERGPEAAGIIVIDQGYVFGADLIYQEADGEPIALDVDQNFLSAQSAAVSLEKMQALRVAGALQSRMIDGEVVVLSGDPYSLYGHWMVDFMPRLHLLRSSGRQLSDVRFLLPSDLPQFARDWLALAGVSDDQLVFYDRDNELCHCERLLVPTNLRHGNRAVPIMSEAAAWMTDIAGARSIDATRLLYVSRENWGNITRKLENYAAVEAVMVDYGFEVVFPEKLAIPDQAKLLASARMVVGDYGSGLHNTIFSRPDMQVVALRGTAAHPGFLQSGLCEIAGQRLSYVFGRTWADERGFQRYEIDTRDLRQCLDALRPSG